MAKWTVKGYESLFFYKIFWIFYIFLFVYVAKEMMRPIESKFTMQGERRVPLVCYFNG